MSNSSAQRRCSTARSASPAFRYSLPKLKRRSALSRPIARRSSKRLIAGLGADIVISWPTARGCKLSVLVGDELAALAIDPVHWINHLLFLTVDGALDMCVEPPLRPVAIQNALWKFVDGVLEDEYFVVTVDRL